LIFPLWRTIIDNSRTYFKKKENLFEILIF